MRPETRQALEQAQREHYPERVAVIAAYCLSGWEEWYPWPGPRWMQGRYETWNNYQLWLLKYAGMAWGTK